MLIQAVLCLPDGSRTTGCGEEIRIGGIHAKDYNLCDLAEDLGSGFINLPEEAFDRYGILQMDFAGLLGKSYEVNGKLRAIRASYQNTSRSSFNSQVKSLRHDYYGFLPDHVKSWMLDEIEIGKSYLISHRTHLGKADLAVMTRLVLKTAYESSALHYFEWLGSLVTRKPL